MWLGNPEVSRNCGEFCYLFHPDSALILHVRTINMLSSAINVEVPGKYSTHCIVPSLTS